MDRAISFLSVEPEPNKLDNFTTVLRSQAVSHDTIYMADSFVFTFSHCLRLKAIRYESAS